MSAGCAVIATAAAACAGSAGAGAGESGPAAAVHAAADVTSRAGTSRLDTTMTMTASGKTSTLHGQGTFDFRAGTGALAMSVPTIAGKTDQLQEVLTPQALYLSGPTIGVPSGKWARMTVSQLIDGDLISSGMTNPATSFAMLRAADVVDDAGTADVDGTPVRHYHGTVDLTRVQVTGAPEAQVAAGSASEPPAAGPGGVTEPLVPFDAYLDAQDRLREVDEAFTLDVPVSGSAPQAVTVVSSTRFYDFGAPVDVVLPPSADVVDAVTATAEPTPHPTARRSTTTRARTTPAAHATATRAAMPRPATPVAR